MRQCVCVYIGIGVYVNDGVGRGREGGILLDGIIGLVDTVNHVMVTKEGWCGGSTDPSAY